MTKAGKNLKAWAKKAAGDVRKDPTVILKQVGKMQKRGENITRKGMDAYGKAQSGDYLGAIKSGHQTYRAAVGGKKDDQWLKSNSKYRRATNVGTKTYLSAEAFHAGDSEQGFKHAMDAARAAVGRAKLHEMQQTKAGRHAIAAQQAFTAARGSHSGGAGRGESAMAGANAYADRRAAQTAKKPAVAPARRAPPTTAPPARAPAKRTPRTM
jgi:hypothetical protein